MLKTYSRSGLSFQYPADWKIEEEVTEPIWTVTLESPDGALLVIQHDGNSPTVEQMVDSTIEVLREEYPELDEEEKLETLAGQPAFGHNVNFFSMDLTCTCWTRSFFTHQGTALLMFQTADVELETVQPAFNAICASLTIEE